MKNRVTASFFHPNNIQRHAAGFRGYRHSSIVRFDRTANALSSSRSNGAPISTRIPHEVWGWTQRRLDASAQRNTGLPRFGPCCRQMTTSFASEREFHNVADETLEQIQDAVEDLFDQHAPDSDEDEVEVNLAAGVLTLTFGRHGTWVINKQTPNRQIWWSSPVSGPRRYEYVPTTDDEDSDEGFWMYTRTMDNVPPGVNDSEKHDTLGEALSNEIRELYDFKLDLDV